MEDGELDFDELQGMFGFDIDIEKLTNDIMQ